MPDSIFYPPIGITGFAGCGKDTLALALIKSLEKRGLPVKRTSIAGDLLRSMLFTIIAEGAGISTHTEDREEKNMCKIESPVEECVGKLPIFQESMNE